MGSDFDKSYVDLTPFLRIQSDPGLRKLTDTDGVNLAELVELDDGDGKLYFDEYYLKTPPELKMFYKFNRTVQFAKQLEYRFSMRDNPKNDLREKTDEEICRNYRNFPKMGFDAGAGLFCGGEKFVNEAYWIFENQSYDTKNSLDVKPSSLNKIYFSLFPADQMMKLIEEEIEKAKNNYYKRDTNISKRPIWFKIASYYLTESKKIELIENAFKNGYGMGAFGLIGTLQDPAKQTKYLRKAIVESHDSSIVIAGIYQIHTLANAEDRIYFVDYVLDNAAGEIAKRTKYGERYFGSFIEAAATQLFNLPADKIHLRILRIMHSDYSSLHSDFIENYIVSAIKNTRYVKDGNHSKDILEQVVTMKKFRRMWKVQVEAVRQIKTLPYKHRLLTYLRAAPTQSTLYDRYINLVEEALKGLKGSDLEIFTWKILTRNSGDLAYLVTKHEFFDKLNGDNIYGLLNKVSLDNSSYYHPFSRDLNDEERRPWLLNRLLDNMIRRDEINVNQKKWINLFREIVTGKQSAWNEASRRQVAYLLPRIPVANRAALCERLKVVLEGNDYKRLIQREGLCKE